MLNERGNLVGGLLQLQWLSPLICQYFYLSKRVAYYRTFPVDLAFLLTVILTQDVTLLLTLVPPEAWHCCIRSCLSRRDIATMYCASFDMTFLLPIARHITPCCAYETWHFTPILFVCLAGHYNGTTCCALPDVSRVLLLCRMRLLNTSFVSSLVVPDETSITGMSNEYLGIRQSSMYWLTERKILQVLAARHGTWRRCCVQ